MTKNIFQMIVMFFAIYGVLMSIFSLAHSVINKKKLGGAIIRPVLVVKNCAEVIEGVVRNIALGSGLNNLPFNRTITIVDVGSDDGTKEILYKLKDIYDFLDIVGKEHVTQILDVQSMEQTIDEGQCFLQ